MSKIVVLGGGVCGLTAGLLLARDGHEVSVIERDPEPAPASSEQAWQEWSREGVTQFRLAHYLQSRGWEVLQHALPDVAEALVAAGAARFDPLAMMPPPLAEAGSQPGDERFATYTARRPVFEQVLGRAAQEQPGLEVRRGATVSELLVAGEADAPHVYGVRLRDGEQLTADLVIDAMGRRSPLPRLLEDVGARPLHEESADSGFIYYGRYFRARDGQGMPQPMAPLLMPMGTFSILTLPSDNDTWSVTLYISSGDQPLKRMRELERWTATVRACPLHAHWLEGEPISDVLSMGGIVDRCRRLVLDGEPVATGVLLLGDAWACTNPSLGRGMTFGLMHAEGLPRIVAEHLHEPRELALAWDAFTEAELAPWYRETVAEDRDRLGEIEALREGREPPVPQPGSFNALRMGLMAAMLQDPGLFRSFIESRCCLSTLGETFARDGVAERVGQLAQGFERMAPPGPGREELLALLA